jgi:hypothetical protein
MKGERVPNRPKCGCCLEPVLQVAAFGEVVCLRCGIVYGPMFRLPLGEEREWFRTGPRWLLALAYLGGVIVGPLDPGGER